MTRPILLIAFLFAVHIRPAAAWGGTIEARDLLSGPVPFDAPERCSTSAGPNESLRPDDSGPAEFFDNLSWLNPVPENFVDAVLELHAWGMVGSNDVRCAAVLKIDPLARSALGSLGCTAAWCKGVRGLAGDELPGTVLGRLFSDNSSPSPALALLLSLAVPEPSTLILFCSALSGLLLSRLNR